MNEKSNDKDDIRLLYNVSISDIAFFKKQQITVTNYTAAIYAVVITIGLKLFVSKFYNPQIRTGFKIETEFKLEQANGAMVYKMYEKDVKIKKITSTKSLKKQGNRHPKGIKSEVYLSLEKDIETKKIEFF